MPKRVDVRPEDLYLSASTVDTHADDLHTRHLSADARIDAAQKGLPAAAAAAMGSAVTKWQTDTTRIFGRMIDHADGLRTGANQYQQVDETAAEQLKKSEQALSDLDLGL